MTGQQTRITVLAAVLLLTAVSAQRTAAGVGFAGGDAAAYHGAWQLYRRLAELFGRAALRAEAAYWQAVQP